MTCSLFPVFHWSLYCCRVTQPYHHKPCGISVATSLFFFALQLMSMLSQCCFMVQSPQWQQWWDFKEQVVLSLSSPSWTFAKNGSETNLWLWWPRPLICDPLCLCLWNMAYFLHLICRAMDNMVWQGLFRCLLFPAQSMMECNYQEYRVKPLGQRPFPASLPGMSRPRSLCPNPCIG